MMGESKQELFQVGVVVGVHGLRGDLKVRPQSDGSNIMLSAAELWLAHPGAKQERFVPLRALLHKKYILLRFKEAAQPEEAQRLVGCEIFMPYADLPPAGEDEDYWCDLEGLTVIDRRRGTIGRLDALFSTAAHDVYVVNGPFGEVMIPAVKQFVGDIDRQAKTMRVDLPDGLVPDIAAL
ncbi:MAG: ribosome maturation factor RimM [Desulfuromonadales bacterium]|nr:ribosome maturation factor RimM [Desulfuromonadales bacterium]MDT8423586.1 ribosome maturation factor RimM [Desulfuromonadales bacterium]